MKFLLSILFKYYLSKVMKDDEVLKRNNDFMQKIQQDKNMFRVIENTNISSKINQTGKNYKSSQKTVNIELNENENGNIVNFKLFNGDKSEVTIPDILSSKFKVEKAQNYTLNQIGFQSNITNTAIYEIKNKVKQSILKFNLNQFDNEVRQVSIKLKGNFEVMGLGERFKTLFQKSGTYTIRAMDNPSSDETGKSPGNSMYGTHPIVYLIQKDNNYIVKTIFLNNLSPQDWIMEVNDFQTEFKIITNGNILDFYQFESENLNNAVKTYQTIIGTPVLPPIQALGWNQCRWGYKDIKMNQEVIDNQEKHQLPLDVFWNDIDYMDQFRNFTLDPVNFPLDEFKLFRTMIRDKGIHYVPIVDAGIKIDKDYPTWADGNENQVQIKSKYTQKDLTGWVWPTLVNFPDFYSPNATEWWLRGLDKLWDIVEFDGIWLDMNEASNFCAGEQPNECPSDSKEFNPTNDEYPDQIPGGRDPLSKSISPSAYHWDKKDLSFNPVFNEKQLHNTFGQMEGRATHAWFKKENIRPFIIARSTTMGSGKFNSHWLGDNASKWEDLVLSIPGVVNFNAFGIPFVGPDTCGFNNDVNQELCYRWTQLSLWYPFSRNHSSNDTKRQEPQMFNQNFMDMFKKAVYNKYRLIQYYYSILTDINLNGGMLFKPIFANQPKYQINQAQENQSFMIGDDIIVAPIVDPNEFKSIYLPIADLWLDMSSQKILTGEQTQTVKFTTMNVEDKGALADIPYFIRVSSAIPVFDVGLHENVNISTLLQRSINILIIPDKEFNCRGQLQLDDGISYTQITSKQVFECRQDKETDKKIFEVSCEVCTNTVHINQIEMFDIQSEVWDYQRVNSETMNFSIALDESRLYNLGYEQENAIQGDLEYMDEQDGQQDQYGIDYY